MTRISRNVAAGCAFLAALTLSGCGGTSDTSPSTSFPIGGTTGTGTTVSGESVALTTTAGSGNGCITLTWTPTNLTGATFDVVRTESGSTTTVASGTTATRYVDTGLTRDTAYSYQVVAHDTSSSQVTSNTGTATAFGPTALGIGDPPSTSNGPDLLFSTANYTLVTSATSADASANYFTLSLTLNRTAQVSDLQSIQYQGTTYTASSVSGWSAGITTSGSQITFDSRTAGITLSPQSRPVAQGGFYSLTATAAGATLEITAPAGFLGRQPITSTITDGSGRAFTFSIANNS